MGLMVLVENVFTSRAQWWVMREDGVWKGQAGKSKWHRRCGLATPLPTLPMRNLQEAAAAAWQNARLAATYHVRLPHTSARPDGGPGDGGGMCVCGGARLKAAMVIRQCRGFSQASPGQDLLMPGLDLPFLVFWTE